MDINHGQGPHKESPFFHRTFFQLMATQLKICIYDRANPKFKPFKCDGCLRIVIVISFIVSFILRMSSLPHKAPRATNAVLLYVLHRLLIFASTSASDSPDGDPIKTSACLIRSSAWSFHNFGWATSIISSA